VTCLATYRYGYVASTSRPTRRSTTQGCNADNAGTAKYGFGPCGTDELGALDHADMHAHESGGIATCRPQRPCKGAVRVQVYKSIAAVSQALQPPVTVFTWSDLHRSALLQPIRAVFAHASSSALQPTCSSDRSTLYHLHPRASGDERIIKYLYSRAPNYLCLPAQPWLHPAQAFSHFAMKSLWNDSILLT